MEAYAFGETIVVCRPEQIREAAIVASYAQPNTFWPPVVLEPPPVTEAEFRRRFDAYRTARDARDQSSFGVRPATKDEDRALILDADRHVEALTAYRVWARRARIVSELLAGAGVKRAIFLCDIPAEELAVIDPVPVTRIADRRYPLLPPEVVTVHLVRGDDESLDAFAERSWTTLRDDPRPAGAIAVRDDGVASFVTGLARAARDGVPLRVDEHAEPGPPFVDLAPPDGAGDEAVLVEAAPDAARLLGIPYARRRGARVIVRDEPDVAPIEAAREAMQTQRESRAGGKGRWKVAQFFMSAEAVARDAFRDAVTAEVPPAIVDLVGDRQLTALTAGVPYNALKRGQADWSRKPIGHVTGDGSLLLLHELLAREDGGPTFGVFFDPGFFEASTETADVLDQLKSAALCTVALRGDAASSIALTHLGAVLPLELIFLNTHGNDQAVLFADVVLPGYKLAQRVRFAARPLVFNSSCESWVGVGRAFIAAGARAYVGTLWSVFAGEAAAYSRTVVDRVANGGMTTAAAMRGTPDPDELAYVFVGPVGARFAEPAAAANPDRSASLRTAMRTLLAALQSWLIMSPANPPTARFLSALAKALWERANLLSAELDRLPDAGTPEETADDLLERLAAMIALLPFDAAFGPAIAALQSAVGAAIQRITDQDVTLRRISRWSELRGRFALATGDAAAEEFLRAIAARGSGAPAPELYLQLSGAYRRQGDVPNALATAMIARDQTEALDDAGSRRTRMNVFGTLAQLQVRSGDSASAIESARNGLRLAEDDDDLSERVAFTLDLARAHLAAAHTADGLDFAKRALDLAAASYDLAAVAAAYGMVGGALTQGRRFAEARAAVNAGLALAQAAGDLAAVGDFQQDFARISTAQGDAAGALAAHRAAILAFVAARSADGIRRTLDRAGALSASVHGWEPRAAYAEIAIIASAGSPDETLRGLAFDAFMRTLYATVAEANAAESAAAIERLLGTTELAGAALAPETERIAEILRAFNAWYGGRRDEARAAAVRLDASLRGLGLAGFLERFAAGRTTGS